MRTLLKLWRTRHFGLTTDILINSKAIDLRGCLGSEKRHFLGIFDISTCLFYIFTTLSIV